MAGNRGQRDKDAPFFRRKQGRDKTPLQAEILQTIPRPGKASDEEVDAWRFEQAEKRLAAANDAIRSTRTFFFALLSIAAYIGVVIAGTTDEQLLRISPVELPIIGVEVPLTGFYLFVPWLFVLLHFNLLIHLGLTSRKLKRFLDDIVPLDEELADRLRNDVSNFPLAQWMVGGQDALFRLVLAVLVWILLVLLPPFLLLWLQLRFLAFQDETFTWLQSAAVGVDVLLILGFRAWFARQVQPHSRWLAGWRQLGEESENDLARSFRLTVFQPLFRYLVPMVPLALAWHLAAGLSDLLDAEEVPPCASTSDGNSDGKDLPRWLCQQYRLELSEKLLVRNTPPPDVVNALRSDDEARKRALDQVLGLDLQERHLLQAFFYHSWMPSSVLRGARLAGANLKEALLEDTKLWGARLEGADLREADLDWADLTKADLAFADLRGVRNLETTDLAEADYVFAELEGTFLDINQPPPDVPPAP